MTSKIEVTAHCDGTKQVEVSLDGKLDTVLQDGESVVLHIYDDREVSAKEVAKTEVEAVDNEPTTEA